VAQVRRLRGARRAEEIRSTLASRERCAKFVNLHSANHGDGGYLDDCHRSFAYDVTRKNRVGPSVDDQLAKTGGSSIDRRTKSILE